MTKRTIETVMPDLFEWQHKMGDFMYTVTAYFTNKECLTATKKDRNAALELQGMLAEVIEVPQDFILEEKGQTPKGNPKWKLIAFGPLDGPYTYSTLKDGQGVGAASSAGVPAQAIPAPAPTTDTEASIRAAVALKAAVEQVSGNDVNEVLSVADIFDAWLAKKSGAVESATVPSPGPETPAPASSAPSGKSVSGTGTSDGVGDGEAPAPSGTWTERVKAWGENQTAE